MLRCVWLSVFGDVLSQVTVAVENYTIAGFCLGHGTRFAAKVVNKYQKNAAQLSGEQTVSSR
jgi:hypothetical protein